MRLTCTACHFPSECQVIDWVNSFPRSALCAMRPERSEESYWPRPFILIWRTNYFRLVMLVHKWRLSSWRMRLCNHYIDSRGYRNIGIDRVASYRPTLLIQYFSSLHLILINYNVIIISKRYDSQTSSSTVLITYTERICYKYDVANFLKVQWLKIFVLQCLFLFWYEIRYA